MTPRIHARRIRDVDERMPKDRIPYIAGLLDGEGGFSIKITRRDPPDFHAYISLHMNHEETIKLFAEWCGVDFDPKPSKKGAPSYYALIGKEDDLQKLLEMLDPWLITKKRHSQLIQQFLSLKRELRARGLSARKSILSEMIRIYIELRKLNPKGPSADYNKLEEELHKEITES